MFNGPPPLPEKILARVLWLAKMEGNSVVLIAGGSAMLSLFSADWLGVVVGALLVGAGVVVLRGVKLLKAGELRGINWLVRGELVLLNLILIYAAIMLGKLVTGGVDALVSADTRSMLASAGMWGPEQKQLFAQIYRLFYGLLAALSLLFQGGMALYYHRHRAAIQAALAEAKPGRNPMLTACPACKKMRLGRGPDVSALRPSAQSVALIEHTKTYRPS